MEAGVKLLQENSNSSNRQKEKKKGQRKQKGNYIPYSKGAS